jgi:hypothetical protein
MSVGRPLCRVALICQGSPPANMTSKLRLM